MGLQPRADKEKVIAAGKYSVGVGITFGAIGGQPQAEKVVHLPRQGGHFGKSRRAQALLEDGAQVIDIAFERGNGYFAGKGVAVFCVSFFAGQMAEGFRAAFAHFFCIFRIFNRRVFFIQPFITFAKVRHIGIDVTPRIAVP